MQFGILLYPFTILSDLASCTRYCIPKDSPRPILPTELEFFNKGTGRGKSKRIHIPSCCFGEIVLNSCYLPSIGQIATKSTKYQSTVY